MGPDFGLPVFSTFYMIQLLLDGGKPSGPGTQFWFPLRTTLSNFSGVKSMRGIYFGVICDISNTFTPTEVK